MIHTYSLIHDDLPSMDDDDFRRGRPSSHKVFGEALAILAGDCLLTMAFETIATSASANRIDRAVRISEQIRILAAAAGGAGMVGGQVLDLEAERRAFVISNNSPQIDKKNENGSCTQWTTAVESERQSADSADACARISLSDPESEQNESNQNSKTRVVELSQIHKMKTGALIAGALELGASSASADEFSTKQLRHYGHCIGLAFQIADDLLDVTGEQTKLGKKTGRDMELGKLTYPSLLGIENSRLKAEHLVQEACDSIVAFGDRSRWLTELARFIVERDH